jgi:hypothetical protein
MRVPNHRWLPFAITSGLALAAWGLALAHGYGWAMIWLPGVVAGAAWPRQGEPTLDQCRLWMRGRKGRQG